MEIAPIPGIRAAVVNRTPRPDSDLSATFDVNALSKMGDGAAATRVNKASGAEEEDDELNLAEDAGSAQDSPGVNYFA